MSDELPNAWPTNQVKTMPQSNVTVGDYVSLRDQFAMAALQSILAVRSDNTRYFADSNLAQYAEDCYRAADAMLAARSKA